MGIFDRFRTAIRQALPGDFAPAPTWGQLAALEQYITYGSDGNPVSVDLSKMGPVDLWREQPHLRTVVSFRARNVAQLGLHIYKRDGEDRQRDRDNVLARTLLRPNSATTYYDLMFGTVSDLDLFDVCYWHVGKDPDAPSGWTITRLPVPWVTEKYADAFHQSGIVVKAPGADAVPFPMNEILIIHGYNPVDPRKGSTPVEALKSTLQEQMEAALYRLQVWKRGGRVSAVITRPKDAPKWSDGARERFREDWNRKFAGHGAGAGGTPILGDGMDLKRIDFSAKEQEFVESSKLSFTVCCSVYHVNPTMVGLLDNANYSNVREFRKAVYGDTLGPLLAQVENTINAFLLPLMGLDQTQYFAEFNVAEKLQGNFEEQAAVLSSLVGAPIMTPNEGRKVINQPRIEGGDELLTPLNMGQPDSGEEEPASQAQPEQLQQAAGAEGLRLIKSPPVPTTVRISSKAVTPDGAPDDAAEVLRKFFTRQEKAVRARTGVKADGDWWDADRWNEELADDMNALATRLAAAVGAATAKGLGYDASAYDAAATVNFLRAVCERNARLVNEATRVQLAEALAADDPKAAMEAVWNTAQGQRAVAGGSALVATVGGFATVEAAQQVRGDAKATKTWEAGPKPRKSHARMDGQTVGIDEKFSNGAQWPGDMALDADESAGCNCTVSVNVEE